MYAINCSTHVILSLGSDLEAKVRARKAKCKTRFRRVFYACVIRQDRWLFVETYEEAKAEQLMLFMSGGGA